MPTGPRPALPPPSRRGGSTQPPPAHRSLPPRAALSSPARSIAMEEEVAKPFVPVHFAVLTVSDTRSLAEDRSGGTLAERITSAGHILSARAIVTDDAKKTLAT